MGRTYTKLKDVEIRGELVGIWVSQGGEFAAFKDGTDREKDPATSDHWNRLSTASRLDELLEKLKVALRVRQKELAVPFVRLKNGVIERGVIRGIHQKSRDFLVTVDGKKGERSTYGDYLIPELTPQQAAEIIRLHAVAKAATEDYEAAVKAVEIDVHKLRREIDAALTTPDARDAEPASSAVVVVK